MGHAGSSDYGEDAVRALEFAPIENRGRFLEHVRRNLRRAFTTQDPNRSAGALRADFYLLIEPATNRSHPEFAREVSEERRIRGLMQTP